MAHPVSQTAEGLQLGQEALDIFIFEVSHVINTWETSSEEGRGKEVAEEGEGEEDETK